jgi:hypothetical protein
MRQVTATEKYNAVLEGKMAEKEFVRQMRQQYPMFISQFNGFKDTVQILKNRQMIFETKKSEAKAPVYDDRPTLTYSLDALDRGIRAELQIDGVDFKEAEKRAKSNLEKNATHYLDLLSGESNKVDKHDREVEVKRGAGTVDAFNSMKKATLKEEAIKEDEEEDAKNDLDSYDHDFPHQDEEVVNPNPSMSEDAKKALLGKVVGALRTKYPDVTAGIIKDFIRMHGQDLLDGADIKTEFGEYIDNNYEGPSDMKEGEKDIDMSSKDGYIAFIDNEDILATYSVEDAEEMARELAMTHHDAGQDQDNFVRSFMAAYKEGGYDTDDQVHEKQGKDHDGDGDIDGDDYMAAKDKAIKKAMGKDVDEDQEGDHNFYDNKEKAKQIIQIAKDAINLMDEQPGTSVKDAIEAVMEFMDESYAMKRMQKAHTQDRLAGKKSTYDQAKEKNKDQEKQLKEAIKSIIKKTLNEDVINEAATGRLSQKMEELGGYNGAQGVINSLENIVTEVESFYGKVRDKIQKIYDDMGSIENEEGLKIGQFIGPAIESAFMQDLRPVTKKGFTKDLQLPKTQRIDPEMLAQARAAGEVDEAPEDPKTTLFSPNF